MRRLVLLVLALALVGCDMALARRLLIAGGGSSFTVPLPDNYSMLYNGQTGDGLVRIGLATSTDAGATWTRYASNPVIPLGAGGTFDDTQVAQPSLVWDGSQWVVYYSGYSGTEYQIGRATSADLITWTKSGSVLSKGSGGAFDDAGTLLPSVLYEAAGSPPWKMWYTGSKSGGKPSVGYADSTNGTSWTKRGQMIPVGAGGTFSDEGTASAAAIKVGSTYYQFYSGASDVAPAKWSAAYVTCTDPATSGTYTDHGELATFAGNITSLDDGLTYQSNGLTSVILRGSTYVGYGTAFQPTPDIGQHEVSFRSTSTDLVTWTTPTGVLLPLSGGTFDTISAENPSVIVAP